MASLGVRVPVDIFTREEALAYLAMRAERSDPIPAGELAAELGRLPLALAQAAAVIATDGLMTPTWDRLRKEPVGTNCCSLARETHTHGVWQRQYSWRWMLLGGATTLSGRADH